MGRVRMGVIGLALDATNNSPIALLREVMGERLLPIWIGVIEAGAIAFELEKVEVARPLTHDLMVRALDALHIRIHSATITDLRENTFIAELKLIGPEGELVLDARPSDAIALALKAHAPIECEDSVLERVRALSDMNEVKKALADTDPKVEAQPESDDASPRAIPVALKGVELSNLLETLGERDFGKYKM